MGNILAFKFYLAGFLIDQAGNGMQDGCLAGAIGTINAITSPSLTSKEMPFNAWITP